MYKISVLVPIYKVEGYISKCAESICSQNYQNLELVFVNDCTPDKSMDVLNEVLKKYPERKHQIKIVNHQKNRGSAAARNTALENATGDFVTWVDADDWLEKDAIQIMVDKQKENDADIVTGWSYEVNKDGINTFLQPTYQTREEMLNCLWPHAKFNHVLWGRIIRKELYRSDVRCEEGCNQSEDFRLVMPVIYYSKRISTVESFVYYYNRANKNAQCFYSSDAHNIMKWKQHKENHFWVVRFFKNKGEGFNKKVEGESSIRYLDRWLNLSAKYNERSFFEETLVQIRNEYKDYYYACRFNNPMYRVLVLNFSFYRIFFRLYDHLKYMRGSRGLK